jgi:hypothetical protein
MATLEQMYEDEVALREKLETEVERLRAEQDNAGFISWRLAQDAIDELTASVEWHAKKLDESEDEVERLRAICGLCAQGACQYHEVERLRKAYSRLVERLRLATPRSLMEVTDEALEEK